MQGILYSTVALCLMASQVCSAKKIDPTPLPPPPASMALCTDGPLDLTKGCIGHTKNDHVDDVETAILNATGVSVNLLLYTKSDDDNPLAFFFSDSNLTQPVTDPTVTKSGFWNVPGNVDIAYFTVKAGQNFAVYETDANTGPWNTKLLDNKEMSHMSFFRLASVEPPPPAAVPEPGTIGLAATGFALVAIARRSRTRNER